MKRRGIQYFFGLFWVALILGISLSIGSIQVCVRHANAATTLFETGWEDGQDRGLANQVQYSRDVAGYFNSSDPPPESGARFNETVHSGSYSLMLAGYSRASYAYCYYRIFDRDIAIGNSTKIGYWIYHQEGTAKIAVDGHFTDGSTIRDFGGGVLTDQHGVRIHPGLRVDPMNQWVYVEVDLSAAAGRILDFILFAFDNGGDGFSGAYRTYVDDFRVFEGSDADACVQAVSADHWQGQYFGNMNLSGSPALVRDDGAGFLNFDWGGGSPGSDCGIGSDQFSVHWTRDVYLDAGTYRFTVTSDDGFRLYVNDALKLERWINQAPTTYTVDVSLDSDYHTLELEYYENGGGAVARLSWEKITSACIAGVGADHWQGDYFDNRYLTGTPVMVRDDGSSFLDFDWGGGSPNSSCGLAADGFSVRWSRSVIFNSGTYRFTVTGDDGVRLYVDNALQLDRWIDQAPTTYTVDVNLSAGEHEIQLEYYENGGGAVARLSWEHLAENSCLSTVSSDRWQGEYFDHMEISGNPVLVRDDGNGFLDFDWGTGSPGSDCGVGSDGFAVRWTRDIDFSDGIYRFTVTSDDGFRLYVDENLKIERWIDQAPTTYTVDVALSAGVHAVRLEYYENGGGALAKLLWQKASEPPPSAKSKLTIHTSFLGPESMWFIEQAKPTVVKILDEVKVAQQVKSVSPNTLIVGRIWYDAWQRLGDGDPEDRAREWWQNVRQSIEANPAVDYWEGYNEPAIHDAGLMNWYARFEKERVQILATHGYKTCIGNFSTGMPPVEPDVWQAFYAAIDAALQHGGVLGLHEYSAPDMDWLFDYTLGEGWLTGRYRKVYRQFLIPDDRKIPLIITECGIDGGVMGEAGKGWRSYQDADNYFEQLKWYDSLLREDDYVLGATIFSLEIPGWGDFDIRGRVRELLTDYVRSSGP
jgi:hypothetical protein